MKSITLEERLVQIFNNIEAGKIDKEVFSFNDYKTKYVNPKPKVIVEVDFTDGKSAKIDVSDYFVNDVK